MEVRLIGTVSHPSVLGAHPSTPTSAARASASCRISAFDLCASGVFLRASVRRPSASSTVREEAAQFLSRQWQSMPPPLVAFRQCIIQSPVPSELVPGHQLVDREVQWDIAKDLPARVGQLFGVSL